MKSRLLSIGLACACVSVARAQFTPVPLTPGSFTQDIVVEKGTPSLANFINVTIDHGTNNVGNTFFEQGYIGTVPELGLPPHGTTFNSLQGNHVFQMPPSYATNNCAFVGADNIPGTSTLQAQVTNASLTISDPATTYTGLSLLWASGGSGIVNLTVSYADGSSEQPAPFTSVDWFNTTTPATWIAAGRVQPDAGPTINTLRTTSQTKLFNTDFSLSHTGVAITNIAFNIAGTNGFRLCVFAVSATTDGSTYNPVASVSGFNADAVVEAGAPCPYIQGCTVTMDNGPYNFGDTYYEQGFAYIKGGSSQLNVGNSITGTGNNTGLPHPGQTITVGIYNFQMPSTYVGNDCVFIGNYAPGVFTNGMFGSPDYRTANIAITSPQIYGALSIMGAAGGAATLNYTLQYSDGTEQGGTLSIIDWFNTSSANVFTAKGRVNPFGPSIDNLGVTSGVRLYHHDITGLLTTTAVTNIALSWASGGKAALFAVSGQPTSGGSFNPISFAGFNADAIVEKEQPFYPAGMFPYTTATMDQGTNNSANTWFERGWVTNGEAVVSGLPPAGSTIASLSAANRIYQMPSTYMGPNGVLIDTNHQVATVTPVTPVAGTAIALLTAGASITSGHVMTNLCILQHANGVNETNTFFGYDWFESVVPPAFRANGRVNSQYANLANLFPTSGPQYPCLFETIFPLIDTVSPITNTIVQYKLAGAASWTTYVMGMSASSAPVPPIVGPTIISPIGAYEGSNFTAFATESGTLPFTNQWQFSADGTNWLSLTNGVANFLNASNVVTAWGTVVLTNTSATFPDNNGQYRLIVSGPAGVITNSAAAFQVVSAMTNVVQIADTNATSMALYLPGGTEPTPEPTAQTYIHAIDLDLSKWLNFGYNGAQPWTPTAPVGFTVIPSLGKTTVSILRYYTANDSPERDPADFLLEGSNDGGTTWIPIASGPLSLPTARNGASGAVNPLTQWVAEARFANTTGYLMYRWSCLNVRNNAAANSMQIGDIEFLGVQTPILPVITAQSGPIVKAYIGSSPTFFVNAYAYPTALTYQWYRDNGSGTQPIQDATNSSYTLPNALLTDSGAIFSCVVMNAVGPTTSANSTLSIIARPTDPYPTAVMNDGPVAFFRLDEGPDDGTGGGNNGVIAYDTWGGHNGFYTNAILQKPGYSASDPDTAALFGQSAGGYIPVYSQPDSCVEAVGGLDFAKTNASAALSVEAWVLLDPGFSPGGVIPGAGLVAKGYGGGGEQFALDVGGPAGNGYANTFRFYIRDAVAPGSSRVANSGRVGPEPDTWHHVVGVLDDAHTNVLIYVDGLLNGSGSTISATNGLQSSSRPVTIGSRAQNATTNNNMQFFGTVDEVAIYNYALSSNQVLSHFYASGQPPRFTIQQTINPTNVLVSEGGTTNLYEPFYGSPTLNAQWYQSADSGGTWTPLGGQTNGTLTLSNVPSAWNGYQYYVQVTNPYGTTNSAVTFLQVAFGPPQLLADVPSSALVYSGRTLTLQAQFGGSPPITYQWYRNGTPLANNSRISGAQSNVLTIVNMQTNDIGAYQLYAQNTILGSTTPSGVANVSVETIPDFNTDGRGWTVRQSGGGVRGIVSDVLTLTDGGGSEATSAFYTYPLYIGSFWAGFTYLDIGGGGADGAAFVLQNDTRGASALGGGGGSLGLSGITPSFALTLNIFSGNGGSGMSFGTNGAQGLPYTSTFPLGLDSGNPIDIRAFYTGGVLSVTMNDAAFHTSFTTNVAVNLPAIVGGNSAYVGLTGADGGTVSTQTITNFFFVPLPVLSAQATGTNTILLSWPASVGGYTMLQKANVTSGTWAASPAVVNLVGGSYQAVVPPTGGPEFYRLVLQQIEP